MLATTQQFISAALPIVKQHLPNYMLDESCITETVSECDVPFKHVTLRDRFSFIIGTYVDNTGRCTWYVAAWKGGEEVCRYPTPLERTTEFYSRAIEELVDQMEVEKILGRK